MGSQKGSETDTIVAISTATTTAAIGIVRLSGPKSIEIVSKLFKPTTERPLKDLQSFSMIHGHILDDQKDQIDEVLISIMRGPKSYTAEDVVEINCHGGPIALRSVLEIVLQKGARLAEPGEFTKRAYLNGRIDLLQAEAVADVVAAKTKLALKTAQSQLKGNLSRYIDTLRGELIDLMAQVQASIDFSDEEIKPEDNSSLIRRSNKAKANLTKLFQTSKDAQILKEGVKTAIIGGPNVGKSSLLNALLQKERAIVTATAGTTRDIIEEVINVRGLALLLQDTAGIREAFDEAEKKGVEISKRAMAHADLILLVIDSTQSLGQIEKKLAAECKGKKVIAVYNKSDLPPAPANGYKKLGLDNYLKVSALNLDGIDALKDKIVELCFDHRIEPEELLLTSVRQAQAIEKSLEHIEQAEKLLSEGETEELVAFELTRAIDSLDLIIGKVTNDDVLNEIFSTFCLGK